MIGRFLTALPGPQIALWRNQYPLTDQRIVAAVRIMGRIKFSGHHRYGIGLVQLVIEMLAIKIFMTAAKQ